MFPFTDTLRFPSSINSNKYKNTVHHPYKANLSYHNGCVNTITFDRAGNLLASGGDDLRIALWHVLPVEPSQCLETSIEQESLSTSTRHLTKKSKPIHSFSGCHASNIMTADFSPTSNYLISGGMDARVAQYDCSSGQTLMLNQDAHEDVVSKVSYSPNSDNLFLSASHDGKILLWDTRVHGKTADSKKPTNTFSKYANPSPKTLYTLPHHLESGDKSLSSSSSSPVVRRLLDCGVEVTSAQFHPLSPNVILFSTAIGSLGLLDARMSTISQSDQSIPEESQTDFFSGHGNDQGNVLMRFIVPSKQLPLSSFITGEDIEREQQTTEVTRQTEVRREMEALREMETQEASPPSTQSAVAMDDSPPSTQSATTLEASAPTSSNTQSSPPLQRQHHLSISIAPNINSACFEQDQGQFILALPSNQHPLIYSITQPQPLMQLKDPSYQDRHTMKSAAFRDELIVAGSNKACACLWNISKAKLYSLSQEQENKREGTNSDTSQRNKMLTVERADEILDGHRSIVNTCIIHPQLPLICTAGVERTVKFHSAHPFIHANGHQQRFTTTDIAATVMASRGQVIGEMDDTGVVTSLRFPWMLIPSSSTDINEGMADREEDAEQESVENEDVSTLAYFALLDAQSDSNTIILF